LDAVLKVSPEKEVFESLPFYYQQLFLRNENFNTDFFVNRKHEISQLEETVKRYDNGYNGGILITGEAYSGKSFLSYYYISKYQKNRDLYVVKPPEKSSVSLKEFDDALNDALNTSKISLKKFSKIKPGSIILFDALELWWENSENGYGIINRIKDLIRKHADKVLFIVTVNKYALKQLNENTDFENYFLNIIDCLTFSSSDTADTLLKRHNAGGISFVFKDKQQERIKPAEFDKLFEDYVKFTDGNIGIAVNTWISKIQSYNQNKIVINSPETTDVSALNYFSDEMNEMLKQFIMHRRLNVKKIARIMKKEEAEIIDNFAFLQRSGVVTEFGKDTFEINRFMYIHIKRHLKKKELI